MEQFFPPEVFDSDPMPPLWLIVALVAFVFLTPVIMSLIQRALPRNARR